MMQVLRKKVFPDTSVECVMCTGGDEDYFHLFFGCQSAKVIWAMQKIQWVDISFEEVFGGVLQAGAARREAQRGRIFAVIWVIWLHRNVVVLKGRTTLVDGVDHDMEGCVLCRFKRG